MFFCHSLILHAKFPWQTTHKIKYLHAVYVFYICFYFAYPQEKTSPFVFPSVCLSPYFSPHGSVVVGLVLCPIWIEEFCTFFWLSSWLLNKHTPELSWDSMDKWWIENAHMKKDKGIKLKQTLQHSNSALALSSNSHFGHSFCCFLLGWEIKRINLVSVICLSTWTEFFCSILNTYCTCRNY